MSEKFWSNGQSYEGYTGRWSRLIANKFIEWLGIQNAGLQNCIDMGCGTGALSEALIANNVSQSLICLDHSSAYLSFAKQPIKSSGVEFVLADAQNTLLETGAYSAVVSGLAVNFVDQPIKMLREMRRLGSSGAILGLYIWDFAEGMEPIRNFWDAAHACNAPNVKNLDSSNLYPLCQKNNLLKEVTDAGWLEPEIVPIEIEAQFKNFDDYWLPFLSGQGSAPDFAIGLSENVREGVRKKLMSLVTKSETDPFTLRTRAWAAKGKAP